MRLRLTAAGRTRSHRTLAALLGAVLSLGGCAQQARVVVPPPAPHGPVTPPSPPPPGPKPTGHLMTEAEFGLVTLGSPEAALTETYGAPLRIAPLPQEGAGTRSYLYRATVGGDDTRFAAFWVRDGKVVNKVLY